MWELDNKESWVLKNWCFWTVVLEKTLESLLDGKKIQPVYPKGNQSWIFIGRTDVEAETLILWPPDVKSWLILKKPWCWERLKAGGEGDNRGWDGWIASPTRWTWVWVNSQSWWRTGKPGVLQSMGSQRVGHNWATELNWSHLCQNGNPTCTIWVDGWRDLGLTCSPRLTRPCGCGVSVLKPSRGIHPWEQQACLAPLRGHLLTPGSPSFSRCPPCVPNTVLP